MASLKKRKRIVLPSSESEDSDDDFQQGKSKPAKLQKAESKSDDDDDAPLHDIEKKEMDDPSQLFENDAQSNGDSDFHLKMSSMSDESDEEKTVSKQNCDDDDSDVEENVKSPDGTKVCNSDTTRDVSSDHDDINMEKEEVDSVVQDSKKEENSPSKEERRASDEGSEKKNAHRKKIEDCSDDEEENESSESDDEYVSKKLTGKKFPADSSDEEQLEITEQIPVRKKDAKTKQMKSSQKSKKPASSSSGASSDSDVPLSTLKSSAKTMPNDEQSGSDQEMVALNRNGRIARRKGSNVIHDLSEDSDNSKDEVTPNKKVGLAFILSC